jgi:hypothetical protein
MLECIDKGSVTSKPTLLACPEGKRPPATSTFNKTGPLSPIIDSARAWHSLDR